MEMHQLRYFLAVCAERCFTRAAARCGVKQPSLSKAIKRLETELGAPLFIRSSPVRLSSLGRKLLPLFQRIDQLTASVGDIAAAHARRPVLRGADDARLLGRRA